MKEATYLERAQEELRNKYLQAVGNMKGRAVEGAFAALEEIVEEEPGFVPAYNKLGVIEARRKRRDEADGWFRAALDIDDNFAPAYTNLGNIAHELGRQAQAIELYRMAIEVDEDYGVAYNNLGSVLRAEGRYGEAVPYLKKARRLKAYRAKAVPFSDRSAKSGCVFYVVLLVIALTVVVFILL